MADLETLIEADAASLVRQIGERSDEVWLTFGAFTTREPACRRYLERRGVGALHVISRTDDWYQSPDLTRIYARVMEELSNHRGRVVAFGASMGAFGALLSSARLRPDVIIAGYPQVVIDDRSLGRDDRWRSEWDNLSARGAMTQPDAREGLAGPSAAQVLFVYDPRLPEDRWHAAFLAERGNVSFLKFPFAGHEVFPELIASGLWVDFMDAAAAGASRGLERVARLHRRSRRERPTYFFELGRALLRHQRWAPALAVLRRAEALAPSSVPVAYHISVALERLGRLEEASDVIESALPTAARDPLHWGLFHRAAHLWAEQGHLDRAERAFLIGISAQPERAELYGELGTFYRHIPGGDLEAAARLLRIAVDKGGAGSPYAERLAEVEALVS